MKNAPLRRPKNVTPPLVRCPLHLISMTMAHHRLMALLDQDLLECRPPPFISLSRLMEATQILAFQPPVCGFNAAQSTPLPSQVPLHPQRHKHSSMTSTPPRPSPPPSAPKGKVISPTSPSYSGRPANWRPASGRASPHPCSAMPSWVQVDLEAFAERCRKW